MEALGCLLALALVVGVLTFLVTTLTRLSRLERENRDLRSRLDGAAAEQQRWLREWRAWAAGNAPPKATPEPAPDAAEPGAAAIAADTVVRLSPPAYFETRAAAAPVADPAPPPRDPPSAETQVTETIPAQYETKVVETDAVPLPPLEPSPPASTPPARPTPPPPAAAAPAKKKASEGDLWVRGAIWLAAISCAFAAIFLVKYSIDHGWLSPTVRVVLGVLFGIGLLAGGEVLRKSSVDVARGLSAAGIAALFASFFAATTLYRLLPPSAGFAMMALTTAVAVALSLRQGYVVAVVGLVGGYLTPALVGSEPPAPGTLLLYLLLLQAGLLVVGRRQQWPSLGPLTLIFGLIWVFTLIAKSAQTGAPMAIGVFLLISTLGFVLVGRGLRAGAPGDPAAGVALAANPLARRLLAGAAFVGATLALVFLVTTQEFATREWVFFGLLAFGSLALARLDEDLHLLAWLQPVVVTSLLLGWLQFVDDESRGRFLATLLAFGALFTVFPYLAHFRSRLPEWWATIAAAVPPVYLLLVISQDERLGLAHWSWGGVALLLALLMLVAALPVARRRARLEASEPPPAPLGPQDPRRGAALTLAALATGVTTLLCLAVPLELEREWLSVAWALEAAALFWLAGRLRLEVLRVLAWVLAAGVAIRLLLNPEVLSYPIGTTPIFNWLLYGYGVPIAAFAAAARLARRQQLSRHAEGLEWLVQGLTFALVSLEIRHFFYRDSGNLDLLRANATDSHLVEWGTLTVCWLALGHLLLEIGKRWPSRALRWGPRILLAGGGALALFFTTFVVNPLLSPQNVGATPIVNWLLWVYGVPAALLFYTARVFAAGGKPAWARAFNIAGLFEIFLLVTFEVRQFFHGSRLDVGEVSPAENYSYSFAWIVLAFVLALAAMRSRFESLRYASVLIMALAVLKVFLFDSSALDGLYRVLSFLGLGFTLFLLAYLYRRFVFTGATDDADPGEAAP